MPYKKNIFFYATLTLLLSFNENYAKEDIIIKPEGNKRSKDSFIRNLYYKCRQRREIRNTREIEQCIFNSKVFSEVEITEKKVGEKKEVNIKVKDRWTLIPIPFFKSEKLETRFGLFVMERNFLGTGKLLVLGGTKGSKTDSVFMLYRDPSLFYGDYFAEMKLNLRTSDFLLHDGKNDINGHRSKTKKIGVGLGKQFNSWGVGIGGEYLKNDFERLEPYTFAPLNFKSLALTAEVQYMDADYKFYFNEGIFANLESFFEILKSSGKKVKKRLLHFRLTWQKNLISNHALQLFGVASVLLRGSHQDMLLLGGRKGYRGVPQGGAWAKRNLALALDYQIPVLKKGYGIWTIAPFAEYGHFQRFDKTYPNNDSYSYGIGGHLYLKQIALPGLGLVIGENPRFNQTFITAFIGRSI